MDEKRYFTLSYTQCTLLCRSFSMGDGIGCILTGNATSLIISIDVYALTHTNAVHINGLTVRSGTVSNRHGFRSKMTLSYFNYIRI